MHLKIYNKIDNVYTINYYIKITREMTCNTYDSLYFIISIQDIIEFFF